MSSVVIDLSKYLIILFYTTFTLAAGYSILAEGKEGSVIADKIQVFCIFAIHFVGYMVIALSTSDGKILALYFLQMLFLIGYRLFFMKLYDGISLEVLNIVSILAVTGLTVLARLNIYLAYRQFFMMVIAAGISLALPMVVKYLDGESAFTIVCGIAGIVALVLVFVLGDVDRGAKLAIKIGGLSFQLSEFVKISFALMCAGFLKNGKDSRNITMCSIIAMIHVGILVLSKDLGAALVLAAIYIVLLFVSIYNYGVLVIGAAGATVFGLIAYEFFPHVHTRVDVWLNPWEDVLGNGWQVLQSLFAIGTGSWTGLGLFGGSPHSVPIVTTDFIFAAVSEEMGGFVAVCIMAIYMLLVIKVFQIAQSLRSDFAKLLISGFATIFAVQSILNIGGVIKFIPSTGITLPLVSYGGSSAVSVLLTIGLIQGFKYKNPR